MQQDGTIVWQPTLIIGYFDLAWASFRAVKCLCSKVQATWKLKENVIEFFEHGAFTIALIHNNTENGTTTIFAKELILQAQQHAVQRVVIPSALHHKNIIGSQKYIYESVASGTGLNLVGAKVLDGSLVVKDAQLNALVHMCKMVSLPLTLIIVAGTRYLKTDSDGTREVMITCVLTFVGHGFAFGTRNSSVEYFTRQGRME